MIQKLYKYNTSHYTQLSIHGGFKWPCTDTYTTSIVTGGGKLVVTCHQALSQSKLAASSQALYAWICSSPPGFQDNNEGHNKVSHIISSNDRPWHQHVITTLKLLHTNWPKVVINKMSQQWVLCLHREKASIYKTQFSVFVSDSEFGQCPPWIRSHWNAVTDYV